MSPDAVPAVSVALTTYNGAAFLRAQLDSIAAQTLLPVELVVSDDGSTDDTLAIVGVFTATAPFSVRILDKAAQLGFADNFLFAAEHCRGELVALCDQDDVWLPTKLETGVARLVADDSLLSMHRLTMTDAGLEPTGMWDQGIAGDRVWPPLALNPWSGWGNTMVLRRSLVMLVPRAERPRHPEADRPLSHDTWLYILAAALGRVSHVAAPLILYRQHGANACGMAIPGWRARWRTMRTVPVESYRERDRFYGALVGVFERLAARSTGEVALRAAAAADRYRQRQRRAAMRARIHHAADARTRTAAWWRLHARFDSDGIGWRARGASAMKDLLLGVTGWGTHD